MQHPDFTGYQYSSADHNASHAYLLPSLDGVLAGLNLPAERRRVFDLGCGNGSVAAHLHGMGFQVVGVDPSTEGIRHAREAYPELVLEEGSAYDDLAARYGRFPVVVSLEIVEHVYSPRDYARTLYDLVEPGGVAIVSTPYHGYLKNLALAVSGKMDAHFTALWDHGHIKFWSIDTLSQLLQEQGFDRPRFLRVGRIPLLAKSMIAVARKGAGVA
jgi:2-polyprenyl-6-hydroxyphenyl methylase/3-demethylubiquinone-9 3-methyltransferase